ncbi:MAG: rhodanese-like domain-containing protein [Verrucomicrobia bacterium]|nr:rhodanese-like domain-containing protein [Verrucomicrobiota bacterium]
MDHSSGFLQIVNEARPRVSEIGLEQARALLASNPKAVLVDVREDAEWDAQHAVGSLHLGKGVLERDIERLIPDHGTEVVMYCGGGFRSVLAADVAQRMGYKNVTSLIGGFKALTQAGWPLEAGHS